MTNEEKDAIVKFIEETIETESSCTASEAFYNITKFNVSECLSTDINRVIARMEEKNKYRAVQRSWDYGYDFTVSKNPNYRQPSFREDHPFYYDASLAIISALLSLLVGWLLLRSNNQSQFQIDRRQDSAISGITSKLDTLQRHK